MIIDSWINTKIDAALLKANEEREALHEPSGKLSASMLYMPLRTQLFKTIGVPKKPMEAYTLGKFKRGNDVENWFVGQLSNAGVLKERQKKVEYRGAIGFVDAIVDSSEMFFKQGIIPHEIKSVTNAKLKRISQTGVDYHYKLQACFYALAMETDYFAVDIVSAEDLRPNVYVFDTKSMKDHVEKAIDQYESVLSAWKKDRVIPAFEANPEVSWTSNTNYLPHEPFWYESDDKTILSKLAELKLI